jgi:hypothetical protein
MKVGSDTVENQVAEGGPDHRHVVGLHELEILLAECSTVYAYHWIEIQTVVPEIVQFPAHRRVAPLGQMIEPRIQL